jgi:hypothetical protein
VTRDEFLALPPSLALAVLLDAAPGLVAKLADIPAPKVPRAPKYDFPIYRKDGVQWASETDLEGLTFWRTLYLESANKGGEYEAKDRKRAKTLDAWIEWRKVERSTPWSGERNDDSVTAAPPSGKPRVYSRKARSEQQQESHAPHGDGLGDGDIPF